MAAMNRQRMGGMPPQQQQQQQAYVPYPQEQQQLQPSRHQQEMQRNMINEEKIAQMSMEEIDDVEAEILEGINMARPQYQRLEQEKRRRLSAISGNRQQAQQVESSSSSEQQQEPGGKGSKPENQGTNSMDFGVSIGSE